MNQYLPVLTKIDLFRRIESHQMIETLTCLGTEIKTFEKDETIHIEGDHIEYIGIVLEGTISIMQYDYLGNENIILSLESGEIYGETICFSTQTTLPFHVVSKTMTKIMMIEKINIIQPKQHCFFHTIILDNILTAISNRNVILTQKLEILSKRSIRDKVLTYLFTLSKKQNSKKIEVPLNRKELSDFLSVDRSALSKELSKLQDEGILEINRNEFKLFIE